MYKRIFCFVLLAMTALSLTAQISTANPPPNYQGDSRRSIQRGLIVYEDLHGPAGTTPALSAKGYVGAGALFTDSTNNGFYFYSGGQWRNLGEAACNAFVTIPTVTYQGQVLKFSVSASAYNIECKRYQKDSATVTGVANDSADGRFDVIYADTTGYHILQGETSATPAVPSLSAGQLYITTISIPGLGTTPTLTTTVVYDENTESTVTNTGTTTDPNNTTNVFTGTKSVNVTNIATTDFIFFTAPFAWDVANADALALHIKLKAILATGNNVWVQLFNGASAVSSEVLLGFNKSNITTYQALSIPKSVFLPITNNSITRVRLRYVGSGANYAGFYLDNIYFQNGIGQPGAGGGVSKVTLAMPAPFNVAGSPGMGDVLLNVTMPGSVDDYLRGNGTLAPFPELVDSIGAIDDRAKNATGFTIDDGVFYGQLANDLYDGLLSKELFAKISRNDSIQNVGDGDSLLVYINDSLTGVKSLEAGTGVTFDVTANKIVINASGGSAGFFTPNQTATGVTTHTADFFFYLKGGGDKTIYSENGFGSPSAGFSSNTTQAALVADDSFGSGYGTVQVTADSIYLDLLNGSTSSSLKLTHDSLGLYNSSGVYKIYDLPDSSIAGTHYMMAWNSTNDQVYKMALPTGGGGGGSSLFPTTGTGTATGNVIGDLDGNTLTILGNVGIGEVPPSAADYFVVNDGTNRLVHITSDGLSTIQSTDGTGFAKLELDGVSETQKFDIFAQNGLGVEAGIEGDGADGLITYIATNTHYFSIGNVGIGVVPTSLFHIAAGGEDLININSVTFQSYFDATDLTATSNLRLRGDASNDVDFRLQSSNGVNTVVIIGDAIDGTLEYVAPNGNIFTGAVILEGDNLQINTPKTPASASDTGSTGQIAWDATHIYVCIATDTWRRVAHATW